MTRSIAKDEMRTTSPRRRASGRSTKDRSTKLPYLPTAAQRAIWVVAARHHTTGLMLLLTQYYLTPEQACSAGLDDHGALVADGFARPILVDPLDLPALDAWFAKTRRLKTPRSIATYLAGRLRKDVSAELRRVDPNIEWQARLTLRIQVLRRWAREVAVLDCGDEEAEYKEFCHDDEADPIEHMRQLSARSRRVLDDAAAVEAKCIATIRAQLGLP